MADTLDLRRLASLLDSLRRVTGLKFALMDAETDEVYTAAYRAPFCALIGDTPEGRARCVACDRAHAAEEGNGGQYSPYACHAGLTEVAVPVLDGGRRVGTVMFGQVLEVGDRETQWRATRRKCAWYGDEAALRKAFFQLRQMTREDIRACADIVGACVSEVRLGGLTAGAARTDAQRLVDYLDAHWDQDVSLSSAAQAMGLGKTKLCRLAREATERSFQEEVAWRRIRAAMRLLGETDLSVQEVADAVGITDYNYFTKVFRRVAGMTPTAYRRAGAPERVPSVSGPDPV